MIRLIPTAGSVRVTFVLPVDSADARSRCSVVGNFNDWQPGRHEMRRRSNGTRSVAVTLPQGSRVRFRYLAENGHWFNDPDVPTREGADSVLEL
jgi:1,4-alpha-glucan branching enzyme